MNIFVGNLSFQTTQDELHAAFAQFGNVERVNIVTDRDTGQPRGFAFVEMPDKGEAENAISQLNGAEMNGRALNVNEARPKPAGGGAAAAAAAVVGRWRRRWRRARRQPGWRGWRWADAAVTKPRQATEFLKVFGSNPGDFLRRDAAELGQLARGLGDEGGFVALAAVGNRRQIGRVGFDQKAIGRRAPGGFLNVGGFGKRQDPAEAQVKSQIDAQRGLIGFPKSSA